MSDVTHGAPILTLLYMASSRRFGNIVGQESAESRRRERVVHATLGDGLEPRDDHRHMVSSPSTPEGYIPMQQPWKSPRQTTKSDSCGDALWKIWIYCRLETYPQYSTAPSGCQTTMMKVIVVEDDRKTADFVAKGFRESGMTVDVCYDGHDGLDRILVHDYDAAVVDVMLPGLDGLSIIQALREDGDRTPILILSAKRSVSERIEGIRAGGDDYMVKPFSFSELVVRVEALVRRSRVPEDSSESSAPSPHVLKFEDLELDAWKREARRGGKRISLHAKEFGLLEYLMRNAGRVVSKTSILENVYDYNHDPKTNIVDVLVYRLRNRIDKGHERKLLHTVRGMGYVLRVEE